MTNGVRPAGAAVLTIALLLAACGKPAEAPITNLAEAGTVNVATPTAAGLPACAAGSATLPVTGLCQAQAIALLSPEPGAQPAAPEGCSWTVNATAAGDGEAILYRAAQCGKRVTTLDYTPGAHGAVMAYTVLAPMAAEDGAPAQDAVVTIIDAGADPRAAILAQARRTATDVKEAAHCQVRADTTEERPGDALIVDVVPIPTDVDGVRSACGPFGLDEDSQTYWRIGQGRAWFFQLGQEAPAIDPGSITRVHRDGTRGWVRS